MACKSHIVADCSHRNAPLEGRLEASAGRNLIPESPFSGWQLSHLAAFTGLEDITSSLRHRLAASWQISHRSRSSWLSRPLRLPPRSSRPPACGWPRAAISTCATARRHTATFSTPISFESAAEASPQARRAAHHERRGRQEHRIIQPGWGLVVPAHRPSRIGSS